MPSTRSTTPELWICRLYEQILVAWNGRDAKAMAGRFEEDGSLVGFDGSQVDSRAAIEAHLEPIFAHHPTAPYFAIVREVRVLSGDVGLLRAVAGMVPPGADDFDPALHTVQTLVATMQAGDWRGALFQSTPAAWHNRPDDIEALTEELREARRRGLICE